LEHQCSSSLWQRDSELKRGGHRWHRAFLRRFADRTDLGKDEFYQRYFQQEDIEREAVEECLSLIESEYQISPGLLRPEDKLDLLFQPVKTRNPFLWVLYRSREEDSESEIRYQLGKQMRRHGTLNEWQIETIDDLIRAWCGKHPE